MMPWQNVFSKQKNVFSKRQKGMRVHYDAWGAGEAGGGIIYVCVRVYMYTYHTYTYIHFF